jgi:hypothetical protein
VAEAGVSNQDIDLSLLLLDCFIEVIEITEILHVSANRRDAVSNESGSHIEVVLPAAGEIDERPFPHKPLRCRKSEAAAASRYHRHFALQSRHHSLPSRFRHTRADGYVRFVRIGSATSRSMRCLQHRSTLPSR